MKYLRWLLNAAIFILLFVFALNNQAAVTVYLLFGVQWQVPLVLALFVALLAGVFLGVFVMLPLWLRARKNQGNAANSAPSAAPTSPTPPSLEASTAASPTL